MRRWLRASASAALLCSALAAQARDEREATVGMRAHIEQIVLKGSELTAAPSDFGAPVMVRVVRTWPHGELLRYDLEWTGFEPGAFDLTKFLVRKDGSSTEDLEPLPVTVRSTLAKSAFEPSDVDPRAAQRLDGYSTLQVVFFVLWGIGLLAILFVGRKWRVRAAPPPPKPTLADRLRPLVERVASGAADAAGKAELERLLVAFWRARLGLTEAKAGDAIAAIRRHDEAGRLLRQVEAWLHMPEPPPSFDVAALLEPYRSVTAESFAPLAGEAPGPTAAAAVSTGGNA